jgi:hygromycin-B 7''-O-kinase
MATKTMTRAELAAIARLHGLPLLDHLPEPWIGATCRVFPWGDVVIKIPFNRPDAIQSMLIDASMSPFARRLGVRTPELLVLDESLDVIDVPFSIYRLIQPAEPMNPDARTRGDVWRVVGQQLAIVHAVSPADQGDFGLRQFRQSPAVDPRPWVDELAAAGMLARTDARWLLSHLDDLATSALDEESIALCHGDVNASNVLVDPASGEFLVVIDWAGAGWLDPVWDFAAVSLDVVPCLLAGHRSIAPLPADQSAEARICWCQAQTRLLAARQSPAGESAKHRLQRDIDQIRRFAAGLG